MRPLAVVILAAGRGTRFPGVPSKVLVDLAGRPLIRHVLTAAAQLRPDRLIVVVGHGKDQVRAAIGDAVLTVDQGEPRGTGHAVLVTRTAMGPEPHDLLVLNGDVPLVRAQTLGRLHDRLQDSTVAGAILTAEVADAGAYGRVVRNPGGDIAAIVEAADAGPEVLRLREYNVGSYAFRSPEIFELLARVESDNAQNELYLTDAVRLLVADGGRVEGCLLEDPIEGAGINSPADLGLLEAELSRRNGFHPATALSDPSARPGV